MRMFRYQTKRKIATEMPHLKGFARLLFQTNQITTAPGGPKIKTKSTNPHHFSYQGFVISVFWGGSGGWVGVIPVVACWAGAGCAGLGSGACAAAERGVPQLGQKLAPKGAVNPQLGQGEPCVCGGGIDDWGTLAFASWVPHRVQNEKFG